MKASRDELIKQDAKSIVDLLFETGSLKSGITRDNMNALEEFVRAILVSRIDSQMRLTEINNMFFKTKD